VVPTPNKALLTGHSISKKVPVLHEAYFHKKPELARRKQIDLLARYAPPVELPIYQRGAVCEATERPTGILSLSFCLIIAHQQGCIGLTTGAELP